MIYSNVIITKKGAALIAKMEVGGGSMEIKNIALGAGTNKLTEESIQLSDQRQEFLFESVQRSKESPEKVIMQVSPNNEGLEEGYVIREIGVYAEDPGKNYRTSSGLLTEVSFPKGVRVDTWVSRGTEVSAFYDPLLAKVIVSGEDREDNICKAKKVLSEVKLCGFETNIKLLQDVLEMEDFVSGKVSTWILTDDKYVNSTLEILAPDIGSFEQLE